MNTPPTKNDVIAALEELQNISRPDGDNEGEPINSPAVYNNLSQENQERVDHAEETAKEYLRKPGDEGDEPNRRSITELNKAGFRSSLGQDQYDPYRLVGDIEVGDWKLDVSDPSSESDDY